MKLKIAKSARKFGYLIWNNKTNDDMEKLLSEKSYVQVILNGFNLGKKHIDRKYYRISLGYKFTRSLPSEHDTFNISLRNDYLEVITTNENE
ncbi:hypothetical protein [Selenomonas sp. AE3005]|uniref:hypothetical protein n=1 Tax=Selenomonas sp. AE3005 TaxID=1485543 RepID=UPI000484BBFB|nr:hypothetical protein [Selenomonas sp. AE3005]